jgi:LemA protein
MSDATVPLLVLVGLAAGALAVAYAVSYNRLIRLGQEVATAWATIDVELERRHTLVPQLVDAVRATATHEQELLVELARRNADALAAPHTPAAASTWEPPLAAAVAHVIALRERYPELSSQQNFLALQHELSITEDRIAAARRFYNTRVAKLNTAVEAFPSNVVARRHAIGRADFFDDGSPGSAAA